MTELALHGARQFDREKCAQRNRLAARLDGVNAVPVRIVREYAALSVPPPQTGEQLYARGTLPRNPEEALQRINEMRGADKAPLTEEDVYIHYVEVANNRFVADRHMFMDRTTLRNIATDANAGFAFMNSHRTGGLSHPAELPMGRTFAGRFEQYRMADGAGTFERTLAGFYMIRGVSPNGPQGPGTDDMHATIEGGTTFDASVGLNGGTDVCTVCGNEVDSHDCSHVPGTRRNMNDEEMAAQRERGVPDGFAAYSLVNARPGELSAVYDGAVPGAGFRKALSFSRKHQLSRQELQDARRAYSTLARKGDFDMYDEISEELSGAVEKATESGVVKAFKRFFPPQGASNVASGAVPDPALTFTAGAGTGATAPAQSQPDPEKEQMRARIEQLETQNRMAAAQSFFSQALAERRLRPAHKGLFIAAQMQAAADDASNKATVSFMDAGGNTQQAGSRVELLQQFVASLPEDKSLTEEQLKTATVLYPRTDNATKSKAEEDEDLEIAKSYNKTMGRSTNGTS